MFPMSQIYKINRFYNAKAFNISLNEVSLLLPASPGQRRGASQGKISRPAACIFSGADRWLGWPPADIGCRKFFHFNGRSGPSGRIPAAKLSRARPFWSFIACLKAPARRDDARGPFLFPRNLFLFGEWDTFRVREKGPAFFPFLPSTRREFLQDIVYT